MCMIININGHHTFIWSQYDKCYLTDDQYHNVSIKNLFQKFLFCCLCDQNLLPLSNGYKTSPGNSNIKTQPVIVEYIGYIYNSCIK